MEEMTRQQAYEYFNQAYVRQGMDNSGQIKEKVKQPLYKTVPELFVGFLLLAILLGDWSYRVYKRRKGESIGSFGGPTRLQYEEVFKGFDSKKKYGRESNFKEVID